MNATKLRLYYQLAKPGIVYGNLLTAAAAFLFALHHARTHGVDFGLFCAMLAGLGLTMASGCVVNNVIERRTDALMDRTKDRALPMRQLRVRNALIYAACLGLLGIVLLAFTNPLALCAALAGAIFYVGIYTPAKSRTLHSTGIGAVAGAVPPLVGYLAVSQMVDTNIVLLFIILVTWQLPHFFAIAEYRADDYRHAGLPVLPAQLGHARTQILIRIYILLFTAAVLILGWKNDVQAIYYVVMGLVCAYWLTLPRSPSARTHPELWARRAFRFSLLAMLAFSAMLAVS